MKYYSIGQIAKLSGCKIPTIRFYEQEGLLPLAFRTEGNQRRYQEKHLLRLRFILHARELGFSLDAVRELIHLAGKTKQDHEADEIVARQLAAVEQKIARLSSLKHELSAMLRHCADTRVTGTAKPRIESMSCRIIEVLSDHTLCSGEHN